MKKFVSIAIIIILMVPTIVKVSILVDFKINQDYIAKILCINRAKPETNCNGQCHLSKQIQQAEENENKQTPAQSKEKIEILFYQNQNCFSFLKQDYTHKPQTVNNYKSDLYVFSFTNTLFRPPINKMI